MENWALDFVFIFQYLASIAKLRAIVLHNFVDRLFFAVFSALGVSGGPDSMALCILTADWKTNGLNTAGESCGLIDGLLAIIVDHGLRAESKDEANIVRHRVSDMGISIFILFFFGRIWLAPHMSLNLLTGIRWLM